MVEGKNTDVGSHHPELHPQAPPFVTMIMGWKWSVGSGFLTPVLKHKSELVTSMLNALQLSLHCR